MTEKEIQDAKTASDKRELERRYVAKKYPLNLKGFESEQAQARYNYYANKVLSKMDSATYSNLRKGMPAKVAERQAYIDKFAKDNPKFYTKDLANIITPEGVADMTAQRDIIERNRGLHTLGTKEEAEAFGTRHAALIEDARVHSGYSNDPNSEVKYNISWDPEKGYKANIEDFKFGTRMPAPREEDLRQIAIDIEKDRILNTSKEKDLADTPELKNGLDFSSVSAYNKWLAFGHASGEFDKTPGNQTISIKGKRKEVKHKLVNGIDTTMTPMKAKGVEPVAGKSSLAVDSKTLADGVAGAGGGGSMAGGAVDIAKQAMPLITDTVSLFGDEESAKTVAATGETAIAGASLGMAVGGPIGAAIGGVAGGALGFMKDHKAKKEAAEAKKKAFREEQQARTLSSIQPLQNTQAPMYEEGTPNAPLTALSEVEKDELVLRKNALGKYTLVADFSGGKTHAQGGEDYVVKEGDIVFPGKKRDKIMQALKNGNNYAIETERVKLPKTFPQEEKLANGIDTSKEPYSPYPKVNSWWEPDWMKTPTELPKTEKVKATDKKSKKVTYKETYLEPIQPRPASINDDFNKFTVGSKELAKVHTRTFNKKEFNEYYRKLKEGRISKEVTSKDRGTKSTESKDITDKEANLSEALKYAPAISNILKGMQKPEKTDRRFMGTESYKYKDKSGDLRKEAETQRIIDSENASRFSGGSAQTARAGKALAGSLKSKRLQEINAAESKRADYIDQTNVGLRSQTRGINLELANMYDELDLQNKAAVDAYMNRGIADMGRISDQIAIDKQTKSRDEMMLDMIEKTDYAFNKKTGKWEYKKKKD